MLRLLRPVLIGLLAALVVLTPGGVATAHDELRSSDPEDGATLQEAPEELVLTFTGQIAQVGAQLQVTDADGEDVADGDPVAQGTDLVQPLTDIGSGEYDVIWRVTSSDGHPISGTFGFTVEATEPTGSTEPTESTEPTTEEDTAVASPDPTEEATDEVTEDADEATEDATAEATADATQTDAVDEGVLPAWVWVMIGLAVLALVALLARTWTSGRS